MSKKSSDQFPSHFGIDLKSALRNFKSAIRNPQFAIIVGAVLLVLGVSAEAQQAKAYRIGILVSATAGEFIRQSFLQALHDLSYVEGKNIHLEQRSAEGKLDRLPILAAELVSLKADVIVASSTTASAAAKKATATIPIVMTNVTDPVATGLVASLARPGGNITGLST